MDVVDGVCNCVVGLPDKRANECRYKDNAPNRLINESIFFYCALWISKSFKVILNFFLKTDVCDSVFSILSQKGEYCHMFLCAPAQRTSTFVYTSKEEGYLKGSSISRLNLSYHRHHHLPLSPCQSVSTLLSTSQSSLVRRCVLRSLAYLGHFLSSSLKGRLTHHHIFCTASPHTASNSHD